jgi:hypothetical protein
VYEILVVQTSLKGYLEISLFFAGPNDILTARFDCKYEMPLDLFDIDCPAPYFQDCTYE